MITNKLNIPQIFIDCVENNREFQQNRYSVTELLQPTQCIQLIRKHFNEIDEDAADLIPALIGTAVHKMLQEKTPEENAEVKLETQFKNIQLVGILDYLDLKNLLITDYKVTSVYKYQAQEFDDYYKQGALYSLLVYLIYDVKIKKVNFQLLLKDWSKIKALTTNNYPASPIVKVEYDINDSDFDFIIEWLNNKLLELSSNKNECSDSDRWYTGKKYAVYKKAGDKRASYITNDEIDAHNYITNKCDGAAEIQVRQGENIKCKYYCKARSVCPQYEKIRRNE